MRDGSSRERAGHRADFVVVGGGLAGLAAATLVARRGFRVALVERAVVLGDRGRTSVEHGFHLNFGPHALYRGGVTMTVLESLGVTPSGAAAPVDGALVLDGASRHALPATGRALAKTGLFGLGAKLEAARVLNPDPSPRSDGLARAIPVRVARDDRTPPRRPAAAGSTRATRNVLARSSNALEPNTDPPGDIETRLEGLLDDLQPGWSDRLVARRFLPAMTASSALVRAADGGLPTRPGPRVNGVDGCFVAGDWVGTEGLLADAALASARSAADAAVTFLRTRTTAA